MNIPKWKKKSIHLIQNSSEERTRENIKKKIKKLKIRQKYILRKKLKKKREESEKLGRISRAFNFHFL